MTALTVIKTDTDDDNKSMNKKLVEKIRSRSTNEIIIAFSGLMGSGISGMVDTFIKKFEKKGYITEHIKLSDFIKNRYCDLKDELKDNYLDYKSLDNELDKLSYFKKIAVQQSIGNYLRGRYSTSILSQYALTNILNNRIGADIHDKDLEEKFDEVLSEAKDENIKRVTFVDSIKHIDEYNLLRTVYNNMFYLIGILCPEKIRMERILSDYNVEETELQVLIDRDKKEDLDNGQQALKVLQESDVFLRNISLDTSNESVERYVDLILGEPYIKPTVDEFGMFTAQAAAQQSGCISRQVGASIFSQYNDIISTGCNDAPIYGGGHYTNVSIIPDNKLEDNRCCTLKAGIKCKNTEQLEKIYADIRSIVNAEIGNTPEIDADKLSKTIFDNTRIKSLIEFSKAVHAEMDAITTAARNGVTSLRGATLYSTTFPCHLCATNIIASGIKKVYYIEPYLKSLAIDLHDDQVNFEPKTLNPKDDDNKSKVLFLPFEGVAPKQYLNFFKSCNRKEKDGTKIKYDIKEAVPVLKQMMDPYSDYELAISNSFKNLTDTSDQNE